MRTDTYECNEKDSVQIGPVVHQHVSDEVDHGSGHKDEEHEHGYHFEEMIGQGIEEETERDLQQTHPLGPSEPVAFIEGKVLISPEYVDADG